MSEQIKYIEVLNALHDQDHMLVGDYSLYYMGHSKSSLYYPSIQDVIPSIPFGETVSYFPIRN